MWISHRFVTDQEDKTLFLNLAVAHQVEHHQFADAEDNELHIAYDFEGKKFLVIPNRTQPELYAKVLAYLQESVATSS